MDRLLGEAGFQRRSGKGDHWVYTHPKRQFPLTIDPRKPLLPVYVTKAMQAIEEVLDQPNGNGDQGDATQGEQG
jgi:predicted RNA binding protein YcfA (HicA-like mRNA interferase family)